MVPLIKVIAQGLIGVWFPDTVEVFIESLLELSFSLTDIEFVTVCAFEAVYKVTASAAEVAATFVSNARGGRGDLATFIHLWAVIAIRGFTGVD